MTACAAIVHDTQSWRGRNCTRAGTVHENGKYWCKQHAPSAEKARRDKAQAEWEAQWAKKSEQRKLEAAAPAMLACLEWIAHESGQHGDGATDSSWAARFLLEVEQRAKEAIRRARA